MRITEVSAHPVWVPVCDLLGGPVRDRVACYGHLPDAAEDGWLLPPDGPGLGVDYDRDAAGRHPPRWTAPPHLRRHDGSFTN